MVKVTNSIYNVGVNDTTIDLFEGQYNVNNKMSYNSYVIMDEKIAILDTVDKNYFNEWFNNIQEVLGDKKPTYLIVSHMEMDHAANIIKLIEKYNNMIIVGNVKTFNMIKQFFNMEITNKLVVKENDTLSLGKHTLSFIFAPFVHWPEVMFTYDMQDKVLFSADAFGRFGLYEDTSNYLNEARRYYIGIVGKYGMQVQSVLKKASVLDIKIIAPLHGNILTENLSYYINKYDIWSKYEVEEEGVLIAYCSVYGNTKDAALKLHDELIKRNYKNVVCYDLARSDMSEVISLAFKYSKLVLASITYNNTVFPFMNTFIEGLIERNYQNRKVAFIENGSWAPISLKVMKDKMSSLKNITFLNNNVKILSALNDSSLKQINDLADELINQ